eukprot:1083089-Pelagomonas_calceolata.AAC.2
MEGWRARKEWVHEDGSPNISALEHVVGDTMVCVTDTRQQQDGCGEVKEMSLAEYLAWWRARHESQGGRGQEHSQQQQQQQQQQEEEKQSLTSQGGCKRAEYRPHYYLKDWHFCSVAPPEYRVGVWSWVFDLTRVGRPWPAVGKHAQFKSLSPGLAIPGLAKAYASLAWNDKRGLSKGELCWQWNTAYSSSEKGDRPAQRNGRSFAVLPAVQKFLESGRKAFAQHA